MCRKYFIISENRSKRFVFFQHILLLRSVRKDCVLESNTWCEGQGQGLWALYFRCTISILCTITKGLSLAYCFFRTTPILCRVQAVTWCRGAMVMMQYSVMANNYWLLVEGIYLHSLLVITVFSERKYFYMYLAIGWGKKNCSSVGCYRQFDSSIVNHQTLFIQHFLYTKATQSASQTKHNLQKIKRYYPPPSKV